MGNAFILVNRSRKEYITFGGFSKEDEIILNRVPSKMVAYFLFCNNGDDVVYVGDQWNVGFVYENFNEIIENYKDVTELILTEMIESDYIEESDLEHLHFQWRKSEQSKPKEVSS